MKDKILFILPSLPGGVMNMRDRRLFCMWEALAERYEIHVLYSHNLSTTKESIEALAARGITVMSVREIAKHGLFSFDKQIAMLMNERSYKTIYFQSIYSAKYYIPFLVLSRIRTSIVIDGGKARHIEEKIRATDSKSSMLAQAVAYKNYRISRLSEIALYRHADMIIVPDQVCRNILKEGLPDKEIRQISEMRDPSDSERIIFETREAFDAAAPFPVAVNHPVPETIIIQADASPIVAAYNTALRRIVGRYAILVPPGAMIDQFTLERMGFCADSDHEIGLVSPVSNRVLSNPVSPENLSPFRMHHFISNIAHWSETKRPAEPCFLVRHDIINKIGYFDDRYQTLSYALYDYSLKLFQAGYFHVVTNEAFVYYTEHHVDNMEALTIDKKMFLHKWAHIGTSFLEKAADN